MNCEDVEIEKSEDLYRGFFHMKRYSLRHKKFDGTWSPKITREVFERGPVAAVVPYDPVLDRVVLIEQFRPGPMAAGADSPWMIEVVAGILEPGETPEALAMRETVEETGRELSEILPICAFYMAPVAPPNIAIFCAANRSTNIGGIHGHAEEGEDIRVFSEPSETAFKRLSNGQIDSAFSIIALQWLQLNREDIRSRWT